MVAVTARTALKSINCHQGWDTQKTLLASRFGHAEPRSVLGGVVVGVFAMMMFLRVARARPTAAISARAFGSSPDWHGTTILCVRKNGANLVPPPRSREFLQSALPHHTRPDGSDRRRPGVAREHRREAQRKEGPKAGRRRARGVRGVVASTKRARLARPARGTHFL